MKRLALAATLVLPLALGAGAAVRTGAPVPGAASGPRSSQATAVTRCPWLAARAAAAGDAVLPEGTFCPARPSPGSRCPATGAVTGATRCPRGTGNPAPSHPALPAAGGGVV
ncbi:MAG: hypothetical protein U0529_06020 [Thermoanaerobaculia bacterium]